MCFLVCACREARACTEDVMLVDAGGEPTLEGEDTWLKSGEGDASGESTLSGERDCK